MNILILFQIDDCDARSTELHVLVAVVTDVGYGGEILAYELSENARSSTMEYAHSGHSHEDGVVDEIGDSVDGLVASHTTHIDVLLEVEFAVVDDVAGTTRHHGIGASDALIALFGLGGTLSGSFGMLEALQSHLGLHTTEDDNGLAAIDTVDNADRGESLDADGVALLEWRLNCRLWSLS